MRVIVLSLIGIVSSTAIAQPAHKAPAEPRVKPSIPRQFDADADKDRIEDTLKAKHDNAADKAKLVEVELIFDQQVTQAQLDAFVAEGGTITHVFESVSYGWTGKLPLGKLKSVAAKMGATMVQMEEPKEGKLLLMKATQNGRVRAVWASTFNSTTGYDGSSNTAIAILDSGVDNNHTDLNGRRVLNYDYYNAATGGTQVSTDYNGHGTHVAGIACGTGSSGGSGTATFYWSQTGDLTSVPSGSFLGGFVQLPASSLTWAGTATFEGGGSTTMRYVYSTQGSASYTVSNTSTSGTSTRTLSSTFTPTSTRFYTAALTSVGSASVGDYVIANSATNHSGVGDGFNKFRGVAPGCNWINARVSSNSGGVSNTAVANALDAMVTNRQTYNIKVLNMSLDAGTSTSIRSKVNTAVDNGIIVVAAAGNDGASGSTVDDPASAAKAITVGASNANNALTSYTSLGTSTLSTTSGQEQDYKPDILAPGGSDYYGHILAPDTNDGDDEDGSIADQRGNDYAPREGTSMAAPFVSGVAALVIDALETAGYSWGFTSEDSPKLVKMLINATATETNTTRESNSNNPSLQRAGTTGSYPAGKDSNEGYGMVNADAAIEAYVKTLAGNASVTETIDSSATGRRAYARKMTLSANQTLACTLAVPSTGDFDLYLYSMTPGTYGKPTILASGTNASTDTDESITYTPTAGTTVFLVVKRISGSGSSTLTNTVTGDSFASPNTISNLTTGTITSFDANYTGAGSNSGFTTETNEPSEITSNGGQSEWFTWTSNYTGTAALTITGGQKAQVYTGTAINALTVRGNATNSATQSFLVTAGTTYRIAVFGSTAGAFTMTITPTTLTKVAITNSTSFVGSTSGTGSASPASSRIVLSNITGTISGTSIALNNITTTNLSDFDVYLSTVVGSVPWVISDVGGNYGVSGIMLTLNDSAASNIGTTAPATGTYKPTDIDAGDGDTSLATSFSSLTGNSPNQTWRLYVTDDANTSTYGNIAGGWTLTFDVSNGPAIASTSTSASYAEDAAATILQSSVTVTDATHTDYSGGSLTVQTTANSEVFDTLAISSQGTGSGQIGVSGSNVSYGGTTIGTYTGGTSSTALVVTFNASSTPAAAQALMRRITFAHSSHIPSTLARTVSFTLADGDGGSTSFTQSVSITAVNDTPTLTTMSTLNGATEDTDFTLTFTTLAAAGNENDADETTNSFRIEAVSTGTLKKNGTAVTAGSTLISTGDSVVWTPASNANGTLNAFTVVYYDGTAASTTAVQVKVTVTAVNDAPTLTSISNLGPATEDTIYGISYTTLAAAANEADVDSGSISFRIESVTSGSLSLAVGSTLSTGGTMNWTPASNVNGTVAAFTVKAYDGSAASSTAITVNVSVTAVSDAPTLTTISTLTGASEDTAFSISYTTLAAASNITDPDGTTPSFRIEGVSSGTLTKSGVSVIAGVTTLASGESLSWTPASNANGTLAAFTVRATDGVLGSAGAVQVNVSVTAVNDAPTLTSIGTLSGATENTDFTISYTTLAGVADEADAEGGSISFRVEAVSSGTLKKGGVVVTAGSTLLSSGESFVWTPATNANGSLAAFTVKAYDGTTASTSAIAVNVSVTAAASPAVWDGSAGTGAWGTATNWTANVLPDTIDPVSFAGASPVAIDTGANRTVSTLAFSGNSAYTISNNTLTLGGGSMTLGNPSTGSLTHTIASGLTLSTAASADVTSSAALLLSGTVTGSSTLTKNGTGTLIFSGTATMTGSTTVSAGVLQIGNGSTTGTFNGNIVNNATVTFKRSDLNDYSGVISGTGNVIQNGGSNQRFTGENTFTGTLTVLSGNIAIGNGGTGGSMATSNIINSGNLIFNRSTDSTYNGVISGSGTVYKVNTSTLTLGGTNTYTGQTNLEGGTLVFSALANLGSTSGSFVRLSGATLRWATGNTADLSVRTIRLDAGHGTFDTNGNDITFASAFGETGYTGTFIKSGSGTLTFAGNNTYPGATTISGGTLQIGNGGTIGSVSSTTISNNAALIWNRSDSVTYSGTLSGTGTLEKKSAATLTLNGTHSRSGDTTITAGTLSMSAAGLGDASSLYLASGSTLNLNFTGTDTVNALYIGGVLQVSGTWGSLTSSAINKTSQITGNGLLNVISGSNQAPTLTSISTITGNDEDTSFPLTYTALVAAADEADANGDAISFRIESVTSGTLTKNGTSVTAGTLISSGDSVVWTPTSNANGTLAAFVVQAFDGTATSTNSATVNISVAAVNDAPTLSSISTLGGGTEDTPYTITYVDLVSAANEADVDGDTLGFLIVAINNGTVSKNGVEVVAGSTFITSGESVVWTPLANIFGTKTPISVKAHDGAAGSQTNLVPVSLAAVADGAIWDGAEEPFWSDDSSWLDNVVPGSGEAVQFTGGSWFSIDLDGNRSVGGITFGGDSAFTLFDDTLTLANGKSIITTNPGSGSTTHVISSALTLQGDATINTASNAALNISGAIAGTESLIKSGAGSLYLTGDNTFSGTTTVSAGNLYLGNGGTTGNIAGDLIANASVHFNGSDAMTYSGAISGNGSLFHAGSGTLTLTGGLSGSLGLYENSVGGLVIASGTSVRVDGAQIGSYYYGGNGSLTVSGTGTQLSISNGAIIGTGVSAASPRTGTLIVTTGATLIAENSGMILGDFAFGSTSATVSDGGTLITNTLDGDAPLTLDHGTLNLFAADTVSNAITLGSGGGTLSNSEAVTIEGVISGSGSLKKSGAGTLTLTAANTYTGDTDINEGTLSISSAILADAADVSLAIGTTLSLNFSGADAIDELYLEGVKQTAGTWGGLTSSATNKIAQITGTGILSVTTGGMSYTNWAANKGLTAANNAFDTDADNDGLDNGLEYVFGGDPLSNDAKLLQPTSALNSTYLTLTLTRDDASEGHVTLAVASSTDLVVWTSTSIGSISSTNEGVIITVTENGTSKDTISVQIPVSGNTRLFGRINAGLD